MYMRITWGNTTTAYWLDSLPSDLLDLSRYKPQGLQSRTVAQDANDPENYYSVTVFDSLENLDAYSDDAGRVFRREAGQAFQFDAGHCSDLKPDAARCLLGLIDDCR